MVAILLLLPLLSAAQSPQELALAEKTFVGNCASCHQVPDSQFAVDRAWLNQIDDSA